MGGCSIDERKDVNVTARTCDIQHIVLVIIEFKPPWKHLDSSCFSTQLFSGFFLFSFVSCGQKCHKLKEDMSNSDITQC